jgi:hypothetical protein
MRRRSVAVITAISLLGGVAQVDATGHGGGFQGGFHGGFGGGSHGGFHGGFQGRGGRAPAPHAIGLNPGAITPAAVESGAFHTVAPPQERDRERRHGFDRGPGRDAHFLAAQGFRTGFRRPGPAFAPMGARRERPVYNYYYATGGSYYSNPPSDYYAQSSGCAGWRWDAASQMRVASDDCQG